MYEINNLKRVKRHLIAKLHDFFIITSPGLEELCLMELDSIDNSTSKNITNHGIEFNGKLNDCYISNLYLRTATRILMRIDSFKSTNFKELTKKVENFPWELYLYSNSGVDFKVSCAKSRLYHTNAIKDNFCVCISNRLDSNGFKSDVLESAITQRIFIRNINDTFTVSLDSSGETLYKRGIKNQVGKAPIRETIASAILKFSKYNGLEPLIDPMCGSGTFSIEGAMIAKNIPAGWFRKFAFMEWPCFKTNNWEYIKKEAKKNFNTDFKPIIFASDKDINVCNNLISTIKASNFDDIIQVLNIDFFDLLPSKISDQKGLVVINPPYGLRIGTKYESDKMLKAIYEKLKNDYKGWKFALISSDDNVINKKLQTSKSQLYKLYHGGLLLNLYIGII